MTGITSSASTTIDAGKDAVWAALTDPAAIKTYMMGSTVATDWKPGSPITWEGEIEGRAYRDKGEIVAVDEPNRLELTHFSPLTGQEDAPENYHRLVYSLAGSGDRTELTLTQDNNGDQAEADRNSATWSQMLNGIKEYVEGR